MSKQQTIISEEISDMLIEQIESGEQTLNEMNESSELIEKLFNTDKDIQESFEEMEKTADASANFAKEESKKQKKPMSVLADEIVNNFLVDKSEVNWKHLQEFFWFGIKQFAFKIVNNWDDAYDMTIDTFIRAYEAIDSYDPNKARFSTWLWRICRNNCLHFIAQKKKIPIINNDINDIYDSEVFNSAFSQDVDDLDFQITAEHKIENILPNEISEQLYNVSINEMKSIGGIGETILEMKLLKNMKIREIAKELNMNESTVKNYLYKGKENLSRLIMANHTELYNMYIDAKSVKNFEY